MVLVIRCQFGSQLTIASLYYVILFRSLGFLLRKTSKLFGFPIHLCCTCHIKVIREAHHANSIRYLHFYYTIFWGYFFFFFTVYDFLWSREYSLISLPYICEISQSEAYKIVKEDRDFGKNILYIYS